MICQLKVLNLIVKELSAPLYCLEGLSAVASRLLKCMEEIVNANGLLAKLAEEMKKSIGKFN